MPPPTAWPIRPFTGAKVLTARFYAGHLLPQAPGLAQGIMHGAAAALAEGVL